MFRGHVVLLSVVPVVAFHESRKPRTKMHSVFFSVLAFAALMLPTQALYFYIDGPSQKCFFEELPKDTLVVGSSF